MPKKEIRRSGSVKNCENRARRPPSPSDAIVQRFVGPAWERSDLWAATAIERPDPEPAIASDRVAGDRKT
jgi:hypothetical protein